MGFQDDIKKGVEGENLIENYLIKNNHSVKNVSKDKSYFKRGFDFIINDNIKADAKYDSKICVTGNLFIEEFSNMRLKSKGWLQYSEMDILFYIDEINGIAYEIDFLLLKEYIELNRKNLKVVAGGDCALGILVPLRSITEITKVHKI